MTESILLTVKKMLGIAEEYHAFDLDIIVNINSVFLTLNQLGVGPESPFQITGDSEVWTAFANPKDVPGIQTYVYLKTRLLFDPPTNSFLVDSMQKQIAELEWRMNVQVDTEYPETDPEISDIPTPSLPEPTTPEETIETPMPALMSVHRVSAPITKSSKPQTPELVKDTIARLRRSKSK